MSTEADCRRAAESIVGEVVESVRYVGLDYGDNDAVRWDFGDWHWPEVGVEIRTRSGRSFAATWDSIVANFELTFVEQSTGQIPLPEHDAVGRRSWDVSTNRRWARFVGSTITSCDLALAAPYDPPVVAPVAMRLASGSNVAWIVAAAPRSAEASREDLRSSDVWIGHDEVIVVFDDDRAERIGLNREGFPVVHLADGQPNDIG